MIRGIMFSVCLFIHPILLRLISHDNLEGWNFLKLVTNFDTDSRMNLLECVGQRTELHTNVIKLWADILYPKVKDNFH